MMWMCPLCWEMFPVGQTHCPKCGSDLAVVDGRTFDERLACALENADAQTASRAAGVVARRGGSEARQVLLRALHRWWNDPWVAAGIVRAIAMLGDIHARDALVDALGHESMIVRMAAAECLQERARRAS